MFVTYALTLVCSVFPCTHVIYTNTTAPISLNFQTPHPENSWIKISSANDNITSIISSSVTTDNGSNLPADDPNAYLSSRPDLDHLEDETEVADNFLDTTDPNRPVVQIKDGKLRGFIKKSLSGNVFAAFQSIPFAQPPVGPLRFKVSRYFAILS